jgi:hypothetical protein
MATALFKGEMRRCARRMARLDENEGPGRLYEEVEVSRPFSTGAEEGHLGLVCVAEERREHGAGQVRRASHRFCPGAGLQQPLRERLVARKERTTRAF